MRQVVGEEAAEAAVWSVEVVVVVGRDMDSVEEKNEEMGNLGTCFQGNRGLKNTGRLDFFFILHAALPSGKILQTPLNDSNNTRCLLALMLLLPLEKHRLVSK
ncbi:hypothetical protein PBY51_023683 [Eleginops maclovinus]|uniref:Uncharacterized protein n=1 Tax=Eleginops maclovinus TaxID=56733 RepID=A0AAN8ADU5_ELEMC|nr:hypothetical protein PBY51_023683 [Eleginops maclovinus]